MASNISYRISKIKSDNLSQYFKSTNIKLNGFGKWCETDVSGLNNFILSNYQIVFIKQGESKVIYKNTETICKASNIYIYEPFESYSATSCGNKPLVYYYIAFDIEPFFQSYEFTRRIIGEGQGLFDDEKYASMEKMFTELISKNPEETLGYYALLDIALKRLLLLMMIDRLNNNKEITKILNTEQLSLVNFAISYVDMHMNKPININEIAKAANVCTNTLYKTFIEKVNISPSKFLTNYKMKRADQLIRASEMSLEEIAQELGYSSAFHLSKVYKNTFSVSPRHVKR